MKQPLARLRYRLCARICLDLGGTKVSMGAATGREVSRRRRPFKSREPELGLEEAPEHRVSLNLR